MEIVNWLSNNKDWIFSGIGLSIGGIVFKVFFNKKEVINTNVTINNTLPSTEEPKINKAQNKTLEDYKTKPLWTQSP